jgi:hypothetical protein
VQAGYGRKILAGSLSFNPPPFAGRRYFPSVFWSFSWDFWYSRAFVQSL